MAKAGSAAALAALGALGAMALRKRGAKEESDNAEDIRKAVSGAPRPSNKEVDEENLKPSVPSTEVQPAHMSDAAIRSEIERQSPVKYDAGRLNNRPTKSGSKSARSPNFIDRLINDSSRARILSTGPNYEAAPGGSASPMKRGGKVKSFARTADRVKSSKPTVSHASKRADGIAQRGKTKGRYL